MRYTGTLDIGRPLYVDGMFSCIMTYHNNKRVIDDDDMISAVGEVRRRFLELLHRNRFHTHGLPRVEAVKLDDHTLKIRIETPAQRKVPTPIIIESMKDKRVTED